MIIPKYDDCSTYWFPIIDNQYCAVKYFFHNIHAVKYFFHYNLALKYFFLYNDMLTT